MINEIEIVGSKILLVDDIADNIKLLGSFLKNDFKLAVANNGEQAITVARKFKPDLTLMDINMPLLNGFDSTKKILEDESIPKHPIIFTTALSDVNDVIKGFEVGAVDYVLKPIDLKVLEKRIHLHLKLKKYQELTLEKNKQLEKLVKTKDKFFSIVSHDLKSPFAGLKNLTEMMKDNYSLFSPEEIQDNIYKLHDSISNVYSFVENLLDWARTQTDKMQFHPQKLQLKEQIEELVDLYGYNCQEKEIEVNIVSEASGLAFTDKDFFHTIFRNLFANAIKFSHLGSKIIIKISEVEDDFFSIAISDEGVGIAEESLNRLFDIASHKLERGTANEKGTGLGLIITKELVEKQGGKIVVESALGKGSTFSFTVPMHSDKLTKN